MVYNIALFGLGGTIQQGYIDGSLRPKYTLGNVIDYISKDKKSANIKSEQITNKDSNDLDETDVYKLLTRIHDAVLDDSVHAIMVTMGTDRLVDIASLIQFSIRPLSKPVVFTGSMYTMEDETNDIAVNFNNSIMLIGKILAGDLLTRGEVYNSVIIVMGKYATYAHSSFKINTTDINSFVCSWNKPLAIFNGNNLEIRKSRIKIKNSILPRLYQPKLNTIRIENLTLGGETSLHQLISSEAIIYIGTGEGNFSRDLISLMEYLSSEFYIPQFLCSNVPIRNAYSKYDSGKIPEGVLTSLLPLQPTHSKLAVILGESRFLKGKTKQKFILTCFIEDMTNEYSHLQE